MEGDQWLQKRLPQSRYKAIYSNTWPAVQARAKTKQAELRGEAGTAPAEPGEPVPAPTVVEKPKKERSPLAPVRHPNMDFFICDVLDAVPKDDMGSMEHPMFTLATRPNISEAVMSRHMIIG